MYVRPLIGIFLVCIMAYAMAWTKHHNHRVTHAVTAVFSILVVVWLSTWLTVVPE